MGDILLDSSIAVDLLQGHAGARKFAREARAGGRVLIHTVVVAELYTGAVTKADFKGINALVVTADPIVPTDHDLAMSLKLLRRHLPPSGVEWHDCLIAATALRLACPVDHPQREALPRLQGTQSRAAVLRRNENTWRFFIASRPRLE